jgi:diaminohydroxyphosphoribosylaminopyrimidine deaminase/5-amino-6-(5-phosphoribosylamino)uracil reductase
MHDRFLLAALEQAKLGRGICSPNPSVGAVAVQNNKIIAQAYHHGAGTPHAEQILMAELPPNLADITLYVTLEPCNHWGKTPPCVDAIIAYGVQRVVYAYADPNPIVHANNSPDLLKKQGIEVIHCPLNEIDQFYQSYRHWQLTKKPWVTAKIAQTFDGKCAAFNGERVSLSNERCSKFTHGQRLYADVILTTARTINQDNPLLNVRIDDTCFAKPIAIIDRQLQLNSQANVLSTAKHCHIYHDMNAHVDFQHPNCSYYAMPSVAGQLNLEAIMSHLGRLGFHDVWVEAGGALFSALHQAKLVNKTYIYLVPRLLGENATPVYQSADMFSHAYTVTWQEMGDNMLAVLNWQEV